MLRVSGCVSREAASEGAGGLIVLVETFWLGRVWAHVFASASLLLLLLCCVWLLYPGLVRRQLHHHHRGSSVGSKLLSPADHIMFIYV